MRIRTLIAAGLAASFGGQAFAMTCADNRENVGDFFVTCGVESYVMPASASFESGVGTGAAITAALGMPDIVMPAGSGNRAAFATASASGASSSADRSLSDTVAASPASASGTATNASASGSDTPAGYSYKLVENRVQVVPLPAGGLLLIGGLAGLGLAGRSRKIV